VTSTPPTKVREVGPQKPVRRRIGRPLSAAHILIAVVVILAFILNLLVLQDRNATTLVAIAGEPLAAGSTINPSDLRLVPVDSDFEALEALVTEAEVSKFDGWVLSRFVPEGGLVDVSALVEPGTTGLRSMSLPVPIEHAAGGALVAGDRIDVISVVDGNATFVASSLEVLSVSEASPSAIGGISAYHVVVSVGSQEALDLAHALDAGSIEIVRSTGTEEIEQKVGDDS
jgi:Flp pilus assembly protein CpaB